MYKTTRHKTAGLAAFAFVLAGLLVFCLAGSALANTFSITGKVVAIDHEKKTLTVDDSLFYAPSESSHKGGALHISTFALGRDAYVMTGSQRRDFRDIRLGDWVIVNFHEESSGLVIADGIAITPPPVPYVEGSAGMYSLTGRIVAVDRDANTLTVNPSPYYGADDRIFVVDSGAWVVLRGERRDFRDLRVGDWVTVDFRRGDKGLIIAEGIAVTHPPFPYGERRAHTLSLTGRVVALDREAGTLAVSPSYCEPYYRGADGTRLFVLRSGTTVMMGGQMRDLRDIRIGDMVTVNYHLEANGLLITDGIAITFPPLLTCPEARG
jgi:hypothetical protein